MNSEVLRRLKKKWTQRAHELEPKSREMTYLYGELEDFIDALLLDDDEEDERPGKQWPPAGMAIQVYRNGAWQMAHTLNNKGTAQWGLSSLRLPNEVWRYLPAPDVWPEHAKCWIATSAGEYFFDSARRLSGDIIGSRFYRKVLHVENRPEGV